VAVGTEFCGAESAAVHDPTFWTVTIGMFQHIVCVNDVTITIVHKIPSYGNL